jgi:transcription initiation factor IIE alpha subunit
MSLDEQSQVGDRCEECGAKLTAAELQDVMESGGPALCSIHAAEDEPGLAAAELDEP